MKNLTNIKRKVGLLLFICCYVLLANSTAQANELLNNPALTSFKVIKYSKDLKVSGFKITDNAYIGHAKVAGKYGFGFVIDKKDYAWGLNHRGISIRKKF